MADLKLSVKVDTTELDTAAEKMNRLTELLVEANSLISSLNEVNLKIKVVSES